MATDTVGEYENYMNKARSHHKKALWQEKLRDLQDALTICDEDGFPEAAPRRQQVLLELGGIRRRLGQNARAIETLKYALEADKNASSIQRAKVLGELGVAYRHNNDFDLSRMTFKEQYRLAYYTAVEAEAEMCRAVGNQGTSNYISSRQVRPPDGELLEVATQQLEARVERAEKLHDRLLKEDPTSEYVAKSIAWKAIGMDRLTLCYIASGKTSHAVRLAIESQEFQERMGVEDPTVKGCSLFFYGNALWCKGERRAAVEKWNVPLGKCGPAIALCKEPNAEYVVYLKLLAHAGVDFDVYDEQGFSPLDYAVIGDTDDGKSMAKIILKALSNKFLEDVSRFSPNLSDNERKQRVEQKCKLHERLAHTRGYYRVVLQEYIRPELRDRAVDVVSNLRRIYAEVMSHIEPMRSVLDWFYFISHDDFKQCGRLPIANARERESHGALTRQMTGGLEGFRKHDKLFIVFFSYRWIGRTSIPSIEGPDDAQNTQYRRMLSALEALLQQRPDLDPANVGVWLDCACIEQSEPEQRERGINSLPLAITQCDAMISLVDEVYYNRAWCAVEMTLMQELIRSYHRHDWFEHRLHSPKTDRVHGGLRPGNLQRKPNLGKLCLTKEVEDRPKIDFLMRQSKLLGQDDA